MLLAAMLLDVGAALGPVIYGTAMVADVNSTRYAWSQCERLGLQCEEMNHPTLNTGNPPVAVAVGAALTFVDYKLYKRNKKAAWGMRAGVALTYLWVYKNNREIGR